MRKSPVTRVILAVVCFTLAGLKLNDMLHGPGNYEWQELFSLGVFTMLGFIYTFMAVTHRNNA